MSEGTSPGGGSTVIVDMPEGHDAERDYVVGVVLGEWLGLDHRRRLHPGRDVRIRLAEDPADRVLSLPDVLLSTPPEAWLTEDSLPRRPLARVQDPGEAALPVLFGAPTPLPARSTETGLALDVDVFGSIFFLLSRYEESVSGARDRHERFPASASIAAAEDLLRRPLADEYTDLLWASMTSLWPWLERRPSEFRLRLSHDVDHAWAAIDRRPAVVAHAVAGDLLRRRDVRLAARRTRSFLAGLGGWVVDDPFDTFDLILAVSERHGLRSTFYFMAGGTADLDGSYRIDHPRIVALLGRIHARGHEIGLHASYGTFRSPGRLAAELESLRAACRAAGFEQVGWGVRQHYLRFDPRATWRCQEEAGLSHDSTVGFADAAGFRAGTGREFPVFDLLEARALRLRERPLLVMDATLLEHLRLDLDTAAARATAIVAAARERKTDAVVLYHNSSLVGPAQRDHYRALVRALAQERPDPAAMTA